MKIKKIDIALLIGFVIAIVAGNFSAFANNCDDIRSSVVRLHILANSDSEEDQQLKLMVRIAYYPALMKSLAMPIR